MDGELRLDLDAMRGATTRALAAAAELGQCGRQLRMPIPAPATDSITQHLTATANRERRNLGAAGEDAGEELALMMEWILAGAYHLADLAQWTPLALMGIAAPAPAAAPTVTPRRLRPPGPDHPLEPRAAIDDQEALSAAVLIAEGNADFRPTLISTDPVRRAANLLESAGEDLRGALSYGRRPAATITKFAQWCRDYAAAIDQLQAGIGRWASCYAAAHAAAQHPAQAYVASLAATMAGNTEVAATDARMAHDLLRIYARTTIEPPPVPDFPRLAL